jgi:hypothetical protein
MTDARSDGRLLLLSPGDTVFVLRGQIEAGEIVLVEGRAVTVPERLGLGHKIARVAVAAGGKVVKYGAPIGSATCAIEPGDHVHLHNLKSDYTPTYALTGAA